VAEGLQADDNATFWAAEQTAVALGIDTFDAHWRRLLASPPRGNWNAVMRLANEQRIGQIIDLARAAIDPDALATALRHAVAAARQAGHPWSAVAAILGGTRQAAQQRFARTGGHW
jgi:hypothetical protein